MRADLPNGASAIGLMVAAVSVLDGCWTAPVSSAHPAGEARVIEDAVAVESIKNPAVVLSVDLGARTVVVFDPNDSSTIVYRAGAGVSNLGHIRAGDRVRATVVEELTVFVSKDGQPLRVGRNANDIKSDAKVLRVDPSYRLLTLEHPDGSTETFKVGLDVKLLRMETGDDVMIRIVEAVALTAL